MFQIKPTTLSPVYRFDKSFTEKWYKKISWLMLVVAVTFAVFYAVSIYLFPNIEDFEVDNGDGPQGRLMLLFRLLYDPGTVDKLTPEARAFGVIVVIVGMIIFMGMLISVASNILDTHIDKFENGKFDYTFDYHYIILGFNHTVPALIKKIRKKKDHRDNAILILSDMPSNEIRTILNNELPKDLLDKVIIKNGQRTSKEQLLQLKIDKAVEIWVIGEVDEFEHDPLNLKCVNNIVEICKESDSYKKDRVENYDKRLSVIVQFEEQSTLSAFQTEDISANWIYNGERLIRFKASNYHDDWARKLIVKCKNEEGKKDGVYPAIDAPNGVATDYNSNKHVHLVVFGMSQMGLAIAKRAAHNIHLPNFERDNNLKTTITFIDRNAKHGMKMFRNRYAQIFEIQSSEFKDFKKDEIEERHLPPTKFSGKHADFLDVDFQFINAEPEGERVRRFLADLADDDNALLSIAVCFDDPNTNLNVGLNLPLNVYCPKQEDKVIPIFIHQFTCGSLLDIFKNGRYKNVYPFGMWDSCDFEDENDIFLAKMVNHTYNMKDQLDTQRKEIENGSRKEYSLPYDGNESDLTYTDPYAKKWKDRPVTDQWSSQFSADSISIKMRCVDEFTEENIERLARVEHNRWNMAQLLMGFYFDETLPDDKKDKIKLIHSCIRPFDELTVGTQDYDRFIVRMIPSMIKN